MTIVCSGKVAAQRALAVLSLNGVALWDVSETGPFMGEPPDPNFYLIVNCALTEAQRRGIRAGLATSVPGAQVQ